MIDDYMLTDLSPYRVLRDASKFLLALNKNFSPALEERVVILIKAASLSCAKGLGGLLL